MYRCVGGKGKVFQSDDGLQKSYSRPICQDSDMQGVEPSLRNSSFDTRRRKGRSILGRKCNQHISQRQASRIHRWKNEATLVDELDKRGMCNSNKARTFNKLHCMWAMQTASRRSQVRYWPATPPTTLPFVKSSCELCIIVRRRSRPLRLEWYMKLWCEHKADRTDLWRCHAW